MVIKLDKVLGLEDGEHEFNFETDAAGIGLDVKDFEGRPVFENPIMTDVLMTKTSHVYHIKIKSAAEIRSPCDRCLEEVNRSLESSLELVYTDLKNRAEWGDDGEGIRLIDVQRNDIILDKDVADMLLLDLPSKVLCREDCKGLCVQCGTNLNEETCEHQEAHFEEQ